MVKKGTVKSPFFISENTGFLQGAWYERYTTAC
ncbi:MAG: hypothetical protein ACI909_003964 [Planctomycetota bacterium]|jgi:hypothetical protein